MSDRWWCRRVVRSHSVFAEFIWSLINREICNNNNRVWWWWRDDMRNGFEAHTHATATAASAAKYTTNPDKYNKFNILFLVKGKSEMDLQTTQQHRLERKEMSLWMSCIKSNTSTATTTRINAGETKREKTHINSTLLSFHYICVHFRLTVNRLSYCVWLIWVVRWAIIFGGARFDSLAIGWLVARTLCIRIQYNVSSKM